MSWFWYLTPLGWLQGYLSLLIFIHELGHFTVALATGHTIALFKVGRRDPVFAFTFRNIRFEFSGDASGGLVSVDTTENWSQLHILTTALAAPLFEFLFGTALLISIVLVTIISHPIPREIIGNALLILAFIAFHSAITDIPKELRNIIRKKETPG